MIVWLASYPRSGNTFFRILLHHLTGLKTCSVYDDWEFDAMGASDFIGHEPLSKTLPEMEADEAVHFVKTHDLPDDERPAIYLVRDGRDSLVSFARYIQTFSSQPRGRRDRFRKFIWRRVLGWDPFQETLEQLIVNPGGFGRWSFGGWSGNVAGWLDRTVGKTSIVRYEDLISSPIINFQAAIDQLQLNLKPITTEVPSFEKLQMRWPQFFRKGKSGAWREEMSEHQHQLFWEHHGEAMHRLGYPR